VVVTSICICFGSKLELRISKSTLLRRVLRANSPTSCLNRGFPRRNW
jgi:hypothetical protein